MNASNGAEAVFQKSPQHFLFRMKVCARDVERLSMDAGFLDTL